jgi:hypothetical protein
VSIDRCDIALDMKQVVEFSVVIIYVERAAHCLACRRLVESRRSVVAVVTNFFDEDGETVRGGPAS